MFAKMENIRKTVECPICLDIPFDKIFLCHNGHHICETCFDKCILCPQCFVLYVKPAMRNRSLEAVRDELEEPCSYTKRGCKEIVKRKDLAAHQQNCFFRPIKLCEMLGFQKCTFTVSGSPSPIGLHLLKVHRLRHLVKDSVTILCVSRLSFEQALGKEEQDCFRAFSKSIVMMKLLEKSEGSGPASFLVCPVTNNRQHSWICMAASAGASTKYKVEYCLSNTDFGEISSFKYRWTTPVYTYRELDNLRKTPPNPICLAFLKGIPQPQEKTCSNYDHDKLFLRCSIVSL